MAVWEYVEKFVPYGPNRGRDVMLDGLNKLGLDRWEVLQVKDVISPEVVEVTGKDGKVGRTTMMVDGVRVLAKREVTAPSAVHPGSPPPPEALKKMRDKAAV